MAIKSRSGNDRIATSELYKKTKMAEMCGQAAKKLLPSPIVSQQIHTKLDAFFCVIQPTRREVDSFFFSLANQLYAKLTRFFALANRQVSRNKKAETN